MSSEQDPSAFNELSIEMSKTERYTDEIKLNGSTPAFAALRNAFPLPPREAGFD